MLREEDDKRIEHLKRRIHAKSKVDVVRRGLELLERDTDRQERIARWRHAVPLVAESSREVMLEFQPHAIERLRRGD